MEQVANSAIDFAERLIDEIKQLKLKLKFITKYNANSPKMYEEITEATRILNRLSERLRGGGNDRM